MVELRITLEGTARIDSLGRRLQVATERKMSELTDIMYLKVMDNVSGKILQKITGQLASSIHKNVQLGEEMRGDVFVDPVTPKAIVLEKGGDRYYPIVPTKANMLKFYSKSGDLVFTDYVNHPPSRKFEYLAEALLEMVDEVPQGFREAIRAVFDE